MAYLQASFQAAESKFSSRMIFSRFSFFPAGGNYAMLKANKGNYQKKEPV